MNIQRCGAVFLGVLGLSGACIFVACVGDPVTNVIAATDASTDAGAPAETSTSGITCADGGLKVFPPGQTTLGVFCGPSANSSNPSTKYCNLGEDCCVPNGAARACAPTCVGAGGDFECNGAQDCSGFDAGGAGPLVCCTEPTVTIDTTTCSYPFFTSLHHGLCQASCPTGAKQLCETEAECGSLTCVAAGDVYAGYALAFCE